MFIKNSVLLLISIAALTSCSAKDETNTQQNEPLQQQAASQASTITIKHTKGESTVPAHPSNVVVMDTALLDTLALIGAQVQAVPQPNVAYPEMLAQYKDKNYINAGTLQEPDFEAISQMGPDLIIGSGRSVKAYDELNKIAPTIILSTDYKNYLGSLKENSMTVAKLFGKEPELQKQIEILDTKIANTKSITSKAGNALFVMVNGGKILAYGPGSRFGFIHDVLDMPPVAVFEKAGLHGNVVSAEFILEHNPDWIFVLDRETAIGESQENMAAKKIFDDNKLIQKTNAAKNKHIIYLNSQELYLAGGIQTYMHFVDDVNKAVSAK